MPIYIAMNRFKVTPGQEQAFERVWRERESYLHTMAGFLEFHLLKGANKDDHSLYSTHTAWRSKEDFEAWTKSDAFKIAHARANDHKPAVPMYVGHPEFEGFESVLEQKAPSEAA